VRYPQCLYRLGFWFAIAFLGSACTSNPILLDQGNNLLVNKFGVLCNPSTAVKFNRRKVVCTSHNNDAYVVDSDLVNIVKSDLKAATDLATEKSSKKTRLLIYVHGGLNAVEKSIERNKKLAHNIMADEYYWSYPRFLVWPSDGSTNYFEHALNISGGRYSENLIRGIFGGVATLVSDFLEAIVDVPRSWYAQGVNFKDTFWGLNEKKYQHSNVVGTSLFSVSHAWEQAYLNFCNVASQSNSECKGFVQDDRVDDGSSNVGSLKGANLYWSSYQRASKNPLKNPRLIWDRLSGLSRISVGALAHGEIGAASWRNMKRRAANITSPTVIFDRRILQRHSCSKGGNSCVAGVGYFSELLRQINLDEDPMRFEITLIGHSMGAFVLNDLINSNLDLLAKHRLLKDVVYMAAATSIKQSVETIYNLYDTYSQHEVSENDWPRVSNLMLNRVAEVGELMFYGFVPSGSLLTWIDDVYERPAHPTERTFGSEINIYAALPSIKKSLGVFYTEKITFKSFDRHPGFKPQQHSEFNDGKFWKPTYWRIGKESDPSWIRFE